MTLRGKRYVVEIKKTGDPKIEIYLADETGKKMPDKDYFIMQIIRFSCTICLWR